MKRKLKNVENYRLVPLINIDAVGGMNSSNEITPYDPQYVIRMIPFVEAREEDICISVSGTSMTPTFPPGCIVLLRRVENWQEYFGYGDVYCVVLTDGRRLIKEVQKYDEKPKEYILCISHNEHVAPEELPRSMIAGVWKVIAMQRIEGF